MRAQGIVIAALMLTALLIMVTTTLYVETLPNTGTTYVESPHRCVDSIVRSRSNWSARDLALSILSCSGGGSIKVSILRYSLVSGALLSNDTYVLRGVAGRGYYEYRYIYTYNGRLVVIEIEMGGRR